MEAVKHVGRALEYVSEAFKADKEIVMVAIKNDGSALQYTHGKWLFENYFEKMN